MCDSNILIVVKLFLHLQVKIYVEIKISSNLGTSASSKCAAAVRDVLGLPDVLVMYPELQTIQHHDLTSCSVELTMISTLLNHDGYVCQISKQKFCFYVCIIKCSDTCLEWIPKYPGEIPIRHLFLLHHRFLNIGRYEIILRNHHMIGGCPLLEESLEDKLYNGFGVLKI